jgi:predicted methyltransferase
MRTVLIVPAVVFLLFTYQGWSARPVAQQAAAPAQGGQQGLTDAMVKTAAIEVPRLVELLELRPGMTVADVGAGFGAWTTAFSKWTGPSGRVYSTDVGEKQLTFLRETAKREGLSSKKRRQPG